MSASYDVIIGGASLAGTAAALTLARAGTMVAIIDPATFPRPKACGEGLSPLARPLLASLGVLDEVLRATHEKFFGYTIFDHGEKPLRRPFHHSEGIGIRREILDTVLVAACLRSPCITLIHEPVQNVARTPTGIRATTHSHELCAPLVIIADGARSRLSDLFNVSALTTPCSRAGISCSVRAVRTGSFPTGTVSMVCEPEYQACVTPVGDDLLNVSILFHKGSSVARGDHHRLVEEVGVRVGFTPERIGPRLGAAAIGGVKRRSTCSRVFLAGDAAEQFDPLGGLGMTQAIMSGVSAGECILALRGISCPKRQRRVRAQYVRRLESRLRPLRGFSRLVAGVYAPVVPTPWHPVLRARSPAHLVIGALHGNPSFGARCARMVLFAAGSLHRA
jgi:menaquinone-9 beta-reductase